MNLPKLSIYRPVTVFMVFSGIILVGMVSLQRLPVEMMPNVAFEDISIIIQIRGGIPPSDVEMLVTKPVEESVSGVSHLREILSISEEGESRVVLRFEPGTNMDFAALEVREKFSRIVDKLPREIEKPVIAKYQKTDVPIVIVAVTGTGYTPEILRRLVDERIKERFQRLEGVANVEVVGGRERKILVEARQEDLLRYNIPLGRVINVLNLNNLNLLAGEIKRERDKFLIRTMGQFEKISDIEEIGVAVSPQGSVIRLKDVANVRDSFLEPIDLARVDIQPVVSLYIQKETTANTIKVVELIKQEIEHTRSLIPRDILLKITYNQAEAIRDAISAVKSSLLWGGILAVIVLFIFLWDVKPTLIIGISIPISVIATFAFMFFAKLTLNVMTLSGLALGIGMLVDNSIVVLDNIFKKREHGLSQMQAAEEGSQEVTLAITASTLTTVVVFLPIVFVNKEIRLLYVGLSLTVVFSLLASLFVALSFIPLLGSRLQMKQYKKTSRIPRTRLFYLKVRKFYRHFLAYALRYRYLLVASTFVLFLLSLQMAKKLKTEFIGVTEQNEFTIHVELPTGAKLDVSDKCVEQVEKVVKALPEVRTISSRIERWSSKIYVRLQPLLYRSRSTQEIINELRPKTEEIERFYDAFIYYEEPQEVGTREIFLDVFGYDYDVLKNLAIAMATKLQTVPGMTDVKIRMREGRPELRVFIDKDKASYFGLNLEDIATTIHGEMRGLRATYYHTEAKEVEMVVRLRDEDRKKFKDLHNLVLTSREGTSVYLNQIGNFRFDIGPSEIWRKNKQRMVQVSGSRGSMSLKEAGEKIKEALKDIEFPKDYFYRFGGDYEKMLRNQKEFSFAIFLTLFLVYLVMACLFESYVQPLIIMMTVPLAAIGVVSIMRLTDTSINIGALIGFMMLGGIVVNNAIVLIDFINLKLQNRKYTRYNLLKVLISSGEDRLRPILMTTITTLLGLTPMALDRSESANLWSPLAITVMGGLTSSTFLTLFIIPSLFLIFEDIKRFFLEILWIKRPVLFLRLLRRTV
ncbi:MAG: efflux RND transporter permease subunit [Candidatus Omnitrophica bacterium]|nr:efflux RND transporter permease subunit [Candidatus Omnitrophota bacterium]MCM8793311.1 efflux RND transporter permease subunit [Candidatus Omnitrophota bacterium]